MVHNKRNIDIKIPIFVVISIQCKMLLDPLGYLL